MGGALPTVEHPNVKLFYSVLNVVSTNFTLQCVIIVQNSRRRYAAATTNVESLLQLAAISV
eukprot:6459047-Prymnesium_polylepis.1